MLSAIKNNLSFQAGGKLLQSNYGFCKVILSSLQKMGGEGQSGYKLLEKWIQNTENSWSLKRCKITLRNLRSSHTNLFFFTIFHVITI